MLCVYLACATGIAEQSVDWWKQNSPALLHWSNVAHQLCSSNNLHMILISRCYHLLVYIIRIFNKHVISRSKILREEDVTCVSLYDLHHPALLCSWYISCDYC